MKLTIFAAGLVFGIFLRVVYDRLAPERWRCHHPDSHRAIEFDTEVCLMCGKRMP